MVFGQAVKGALRRPLAQRCPVADRRPGRAVLAQRENPACGSVTRGHPTRSAGRGLILEISPVSFPNLSAVLGRTHAAVEAPDYCLAIPNADY